MFCIQLENLVFKAFHGLYPEEKIIGGTFIVNLSVKFIAIKKNNFQISDTVNYETLFQIVSKHINEPTDLLENISVNITNEIFNQLQQVQFVDISITKKNPPIFNFIGDVTVNYQSKRD